MKSLFTHWRERRQQKKALKQQQQLLQTYALLEKVFDSGQLSFDTKSHRLFIAQPFASLLMANGADGWINSIHAIYQYTYLRLLQQAWEEYIQKEELVAVRNAMEKAKSQEDDNSQFSTLNSQLSRSDIDRIRLARRQQIAFSDMEPPKVEPFEFFIIPLSTEAKVEPLAVGYYDPNTAQMDVGTWSDVKQLLKDGHQ
jgi:hypothetical protein